MVNSFEHVPNYNFNLKLKIYGYYNITIIEKLTYIYLLIN